MCKEQVIKLYITVRSQIVQEYICVEKRLEVHVPECEE